MLAVGFTNLSYLLSMGGGLKIEMFIVSGLETALPVGWASSRFNLLFCYSPWRPAGKRNHLPFIILPSAARNHLLCATPVTFEVRDVLSLPRLFGCSYTVLPPEPMYCQLRKLGTFRVACVQVAMGTLRGG